MMSGRARVLRLAALTALVILIATAAYFARRALTEKQQPYTQAGFAMGTFVRITVYGNESTKAAVDDGFRRINEIEALVSTTIQGSDVFKLNSAPIGVPVKVHQDTAYLMTSAVEFARLTDGSFDPTVGRMVDLWGIGTENPRVPSEEEIIQALAGVGYQNLAVDSERLEAMRLADFFVDLGAIAKGYACDQVVNVLREEGIEAGVVDLGGNIRVFGVKPNGRDWRIGIQDPSASRGSYIGTIDIASGAVATSGDYERYFIRDGILYHHIFDPSTGYPARRGVRSVSVIAPTGMQADALSTAFFVMGVEDLFDCVNRWQEVEAIVVTSDRRVIVSSGLADAFEAVSEDYTYEIR